MSAVLRQLVLLAIAAALSVWLCLFAPSPFAAAPAPEPEPGAPPVALRMTSSAPSEELPAQQRAEPARPADPAEPAEPEAPQTPVDPEPLVETEPEPSEPEQVVADAPPPPELGTPDGDPEGERPPLASATPESLDAPPQEPQPAEPELLEQEPADREPEPSERVTDDTAPDATAEAERVTEAADLPIEEVEPSGAAARDAAALPVPVDPAPAELMRDPELLAAATAELDGAVRRGFATVLLAAPEEQLALARAFGEDVVLVPHRALEGGATWYQHDLATGAVRERTGTPPFARYRRYRDLFAYDYARLPAPLRALRRRVPDRAEIAIFAAVLPAPEWALIVGRRRAALAALDAELEDVARFVLRYVPRAPAASDPDTAYDPDTVYDVVVEEIELRDGTRRRPPTPDPREDP